MKRLTLLTPIVFAACSQAVIDASTLERARTLATGVEATRLMADVQALAALREQDTPRDCASHDPADHLCHLTNERSREFVVARLETLGFEVITDESEAAPATRNVFADLRGTEKPDEIIQLGAHFDAFFAGSDDNASGVAVTLEVARLLAATPMRRTIRFVGYDLEELGLVGSNRMLKSQTVARRTLVFDAVGYADSAPNSQGGLPGFPVPSVGNFLAVIGNDASRESVEMVTSAAKGQPNLMPLQTVIAPGLGAGPLTGNLMRSDHAPLWLAGKDAVFFTDTANFRNANYHEATDTPERLNEEFMAGVARLAVMTIVTWAEAP